MGGIPPPDLSGRVSQSGKAFFTAGVFDFRVRVGSVRSGDGEELVRESVLEMRQPSPFSSGSPDTQVALAFDELAPTYDDDIAGNAVGIRMRNVFRAALLKTYPNARSLFEIGCGTGVDALWLARRGIEVVATDISQEMVERVKAKAREEGLSERLRCRKLGAREIGSLAEEFGVASFDGGFCHAGALNMEPGIEQVPAGVHRIVRPNGAFVCSVVNVTSLFEVVFYPLVLRPRKAFRRLGNVVPIPVSRKGPLRRRVVPTRFYTPRRMARIFGEGFSLESVRGMQILLPPSNLTDEYAMTRFVFAPLERIEDRLASTRPLRSWGHHSILVFRRRP